MTHVLLLCKKLKGPPEILIFGKQLQLDVQGMPFNMLKWAVCHSADEAIPDIELLTGYSISTREVVIQVEREQWMAAVSASRQQTNRLLCRFCLPSESRYLALPAV